MKLRFLLALFVSCLAANAADHRKHPTAHIFINNHKFGEKSGCTSDLAGEGKLTCGHAGHVSEVSWKFLRATPEGDVYRISRKYPADLKSAKTDSKTVTFSDQSVTLWQDADQKVVVFSKPKS